MVGVITRNLNRLAAAVIVEGGSFLGKEGEFEGEPRGKSSGGEL